MSTKLILILSMLLLFAGCDDENRSSSVSAEGAFTAQKYCAKLDLQLKSIQSGSQCTKTAGKTCAEWKEKVYANCNGITVTFLVN